MSFKSFLENIFGSKKKSVVAKPAPGVVLPVPAPVPAMGEGPLFALSWELPCDDRQVLQSAKPERRSWSQYLYSQVDKNFDVLMSAKDIQTLIPKMSQLSRQQIITAFCELMSTVAKYECSWNPELAAKDVNGRSEPQFKATGLFQMNSADDQRNYRTGTNYSYEQLKDPFVNIEVGIKILVTLVNLRGKITYAKDERSPVLKYFYATLLTDGVTGVKVLPEAAARINKMVAAWVPDDIPENEPAIGLEQQLRADLVQLVKEDLGQRETHGKNRSPLIDQINKSVQGAYLGAPYCISGIVSRGIMRLCAKHGLDMPAWMNTASTQGFYSKAPEKYQVPKGRNPRKADVGIQQQYTDSNKGHAYLLSDDQDGTSQKTIEYNTDGSGGRDGDGVYERVRTQAGDATKKYRGAVDVVRAIMDHNGVS